MATLQPYRDGYYIWQYVPSQPAAIIFAILFVSLTALICYKLFRTRTWFCIPFMVGGLCQFDRKLGFVWTLILCLVEFIGYIARAAAYDKTGKLMPYVIQNAFILLGPPLFAATLYMTFGRLILRTGTQYYSMIPARWLTRVFVTSDVVSFMIQSGAAGLMATGNNADIGKWLVVCGLLLQVIAFAIFIIVGVVWRKRLLQIPTLQSSQFPWRQTTKMLALCGLLIFVRSIFRVVEYVSGTQGYLLTHEWTLYVFDSTLMVSAMAAFAWYYPGAFQVVGDVLDDNESSSVELTKP